MTLSTAYACKKILSVFLSNCYTVYEITIVLANPVPGQEHRRSHQPQ